MPEIVTRKIVEMKSSGNYKERYKMNDLSSVFSHYDPKTGKNVITENKLIGGKENAESSK